MDPSNSQEYVFRTDPQDYPQSSTAYDGYLWRIELEPGLYVVTDLDDIAETEENRGREVAIISLQEHPRI